MLSPVRLSVCLYVVCRLSVTVTLVHPTQAVVIFCNFSTAFGTLATVDMHRKFCGNLPREPLRRGVKPKRGSKIIPIFDLSKAISRKRCKVGGKLVLITNRKLHMSFRFDWYQNRWPWMTLKAVVAVILRYFSEIGSIRKALRKSRWRYFQTFCDRNLVQSL